MSAFKPNDSFYYNGTYWLNADIHFIYKRLKIILRIFHVRMLVNLVGLFT